MAPETEYSGVIVRFALGGLSPAMQYNFRQSSDHEPHEFDREVKNPAVLVFRVIRPRITRMKLDLDLGLNPDPDLSRSGDETDFRGPPGNREDSDVPAADRDTGFAGE